MRRIKTWLISDTGVEFYWITASAVLLVSLSLPESFGTIIERDLQLGGCWLVRRAALLDLVLDMVEDLSVGK